MPTPDASAFTRWAKYNAIQERGISSNGSQKVITHLYQYVPRTTGLPDFLPSFTNKSVTPFTRFPKSTAMKANQQYYSYPVVPGYNKSGD
jgi:hypothetical protein